MSKYWKDASSIIVTAKTTFGRTVNCIHMGKRNTPIKKSDNQSGPEKFSYIPNYSILSLKRSSKNSFMPDNYVFPGGNVDIADSSKDWLELFKQCGIQEIALDPLKLSSRKTNLINIFEHNKDNEILKSISLRITGIRETFEESGILLCKSVHAHPLDVESKWASFISGNELQTWQERVQENAGEFINLCKYLECYPDIWSLKEWSNWLSPNHFQKRFNTIFFIVNLDQMPPTFCNTSEVNELKWSSPQGILDLCNKQEILLPPPQYYELSRLVNFTDIEKLAEYAVDKNKTATDLWMPFRMKSTDGEITLLPGDDLYPIELNYEYSPINMVEKTLEELRHQCSSLHRMEHTKQCNTRLLVRNISLNNNHILPQESSI